MATSFQCQSPNWRNIWFIFLAIFFFSNVILFKIFNELLPFSFSAINGNIRFKNMLSLNDEPYTWQTQFQNLVFLVSLCWGSLAYICFDCICFDLIIQTGLNFLNLAKKIREINSQEGEDQAIQRKKLKEYIMEFNGILG